MSRKKPQEEETGGVPEYMATYGDMMTLLLCFFVLLFAFSEIDAKKFQAIMQSFQGSAGVMRGGKTLDDTQFVNNSTLEDDITNNLREIRNLQALKESFEKHLKENDLQSQILVELDDRGLLIRFDDNVLFDSGRAELKTQSKEIIKFMSSLLKQDKFSDKIIRVEGHTDSDPIKSSKKFPTNWELSTIRAVNVARFLIEETNITPERISVSGYSKYHPVAPNDTPQNKAKNRRVDIVILNSEYEKSEPNYN
ncbi:OmpA/MotB family protein [Paramaledivibacter caminithermalis]|jgi:chemotaxis protein MotB|uniref:Chemotaxis protein MotB n=1 Tax=Paramaledivibacter caminithermalis (strain DSM 15212 / CIP 107654 / DViRD3) TaxID=1121301 RepID=A0A1M6N7C4_PARC5|nr:flagellar motor protein MotB [Paramaledivibacter caminithermalis]SHJ91593.1 chemotaxis protein MotB [Paramaledivibacter caminithermalis DSM 15212]